MEPLEPSPESSNSTHSIALLAQIVAALPSGVVLFLPDRKVGMISPRASELLSLSNQRPPMAWPENLIFFEPGHHDDPINSQQLVEKVFTNSVVEPTTYFCPGVDGALGRYIQFSATPIQSYQFVAAINIQDVSIEFRARMHAEQMERLESLGQLTGGIAHDFNNMLGAVLGSAQLMRRRSTDPKILEDVEIIEQAARRGSALTNQLIAFARRQPGKIKEVSVNAVFCGLHKLVSRTIEPSITVEIEPVPDDLIVMCDMAQLENALLNLILNARDAISESSKGDKITVSARRLDTDASSMVELCVVDNGPGIPKSIQDHILEPFFSTKTGKANAGLGLSMVYAFVSQSDGDLRIYSEVGRGTNIQLCLRPARQEVRVEAVKHSVASGESIGKQRLVLVVEDEPDLRIITKRMVEALGFSAIAVEDYKEALQVLESQTEIRFLLTDVMLPGMNGFELASTIRKVRPTIKVVYMSGYVSFDSATLATVTGPFLQKPCDIHRLEEALIEAEERII